MPYQNSAGFQILRSEAAQAAAQKLKDDYGATIFGFGDFRPLTLQSGMSSEEQRTQFNETMAGICGNSNTQDGTPYFKGLSQVHDIGAALNELLDGEKLPKMDALKEKRRKRAARKKALYAEYRAAQQEMREAVAVKGNIDCLLGHTDERNKAQER